MIAGPFLELRDFLLYGYLFSLSSERNINDLKSIGPCAFCRDMTFGLD